MSRSFLIRQGQIPQLPYAFQTMDLQCSSDGLGRSMIILDHGGGKYSKDIGTRGDGSHVTESLSPHHQKLIKNHLDENNPTQP